MVVGKMMQHAALAAHLPAPRNNATALASLDGRDCGTTPIHSHALGVERHVGRLLVNDPLPSLAVLYVSGRHHELVVLVLFVLPSPSSMSRSR